MGCVRIRIQTVSRRLVLLCIYLFVCLFPQDFVVYMLIYFVVSPFVNARGFAIQWLTYIEAEENSCGPVESTRNLSMLVPR